MGQWDFTLKVEFSFLCFFVERDKEVIILLRELRKPGKVVAPHPSYPHYPIVRYEKARRKDQAGEIPKKTYVPPQGMLLGSANALVTFEQEDLEIRPSGKKLATTALTMELDNVFSTSQLGVAMTTQVPGALEVRPDLLSSKTPDNLLAGRIRIGEGRLFVDKTSDALTPSKFSIFPYLADYKIKANAYDQNGFQLARTVTWKLKVEANQQEEAYVDFIFNKGDQRSSMRLHADPASRMIEISIRNCEESEIGKLTAPVGYEDSIHKGELMACYPLLQGFQQNPSPLPSVKLAPFSQNGSGICAPFRSK